MSFSAKNMKRDRDRDKKSVNYNFMRFGDFNLLKLYIVFVRVYLDTISKTLIIITIMSQEL